jgi:arylamine N-acetyltransferase
MGSIADVVAEEYEDKVRQEALERTWRHHYEQHTAQSNFTQYAKVAEQWEKSNFFKHELALTVHQRKELDALLHKVHCFLFPHAG